ncbi:hypothetical protein SCA6_000723 [Theobroma cacao]
MSTNQPKNLVTTDQSGDESRKVAVRAAAKKQCFSITLSRKEIEKDLFAISNLTQKKLVRKNKVAKTLCYKTKEQRLTKLERKTVDDYKKLQHTSLIRLKYKLNMQQE